MQLIMSFRVVWYALSWERGGERGMEGGWRRKREGDDDDKDRKRKKKGEREN